MTYVKLTARPNTWFKAGTEVYSYDCDPKNPTRMTLEEYNTWITPRPFIVLVRGIRVCEDNPNERAMGYQPGDERWDGESCGWDEFDVEFAEEAR